ncbi:Ig-like domain-containing protein [Limnovirga soli]|nr:Ig-like domain-containing protein [Limnovirga soli]
MKLLFTITLLIGLQICTSGQSVTLSTPSSSSTQVDNAVVSYTVSDPAGTAQQIQIVFTLTGGYNYNLNGSKVFTLTIKTPVNGSNTFTLKPTDPTNAANPYTASPATAMPEGIYSAFCQYVRPVSAGGTTLKSTTRTNILIDVQTLPAVITFPANNAVVKSPFIIRDSVNETYLSGSKSLTFVGTITNTLTLANSKPKDTLTINTSNITAGGNIVSATSSTLPDGTYNMTLSYQDRFSHSATTSTKTITIDNTTSAPRIDTPLNGTTVNQFLNLKFTLPEKDSAQTMKLVFNKSGTRDSLILRNAVVGSNNFTLNTKNFTASSYVLSASSNSIDTGNYNIELYYKDTLGNALAGDTAYNIYIDNFTAIPILTAPVSNVAIKGADSFNVAFTLPEKPLANSVKLLFSKTGTTCTTTLNTSVAGADSLTIYAGNIALSSKVAATNCASLEDGTYTLTLQYQDSVGNTVTSSAGITILVDSRTAKPVLILPGDSSTISNTLALSFTLPENALNNRVSLKLRGCSDVDIILETAGSGLQTFSLNKNDLNNSPGVISSTQNSIAAGTYTLLLGYQDEHGNSFIYTAQTGIIF